MLFENNRPIIGVDTGNKEMDTANFRYPSGIHESDSLGLGSLSDPFDTLMINEKHIMVDFHNRIPYLLDKTSDNRFYWLTLIGIAKELHNGGCPTETDVVLGVGLPTEHFLNVSMKERFQEYFIRQGKRVSYICGGKGHTIRITDVVVCPQGISALVSANEALLEETDLTLMDLGGYTADLVHTRNGQPDYEKIKSLPHGIIHLIGKIHTELLMKFMEDVTEPEIETYLSGNRKGFKDAMCETIDKLCRSHIQQLLDMLVELGIHHRRTRLIFLGGGALLLQKYIAQVCSSRQMVPEFIPDVHANAKGYELFAKGNMG